MTKGDSTGKKGHLITSGKEVNLGKVKGILHILVVEEKLLREKSLRTQMGVGRGVCSPRKRGVKLTLKW